VHEFIEDLATDEHIHRVSHALLSNVYSRMDLPPFRVDTCVPHQVLACHRGKGRTPSKQFLTSLEKTSSQAMHHATCETVSFEIVVPFQFQFVRVANLF